MNIFNNPYFNAIRNIRDILDYDQKRRSILMLVLLFINALFDVIGLAAIYPLIDAALRPETIQEKWYLKYLYDFFEVSDTISFLLILSVLIFLVFLIKNAVSIIIYYIQSRFSFNVSLRLSQKMFQYYYTQGYLFISDHDTGKKNYDITLIPYYFAISYLIETLLLSTEILVLLIIFVALMFYNPMAVLFLIIFIIPIFALVYQVTKKRTKALGDERNILVPKATSVLIDSLNAYNDVTLSNKEQYFFDHFSALIRKINSIDALQQGIFGKIHQRLNDIVLGLGLMILFCFAFLFRENLSQILALLSIFAIASYRMLPSVNRIMGSALSLKNVSYVITELRSLSNRPLTDYMEVEAMPFNDKVCFENVSYQYPSSSTIVLDNISFEIKKGETIGFIGSSGSGKTTLLNIFLRFLEETSGNVLVDGATLSTVNKASFQKSIGYVQQNVYIKNGTLKENIAFGEDILEINEEKMESAIKDAMLSDFVIQHNDGVNMYLGENGVKLSGGQKQRVGIARALYKDAHLLLFDEATSALDPDTEKAIVSTINHLAKLNKTIVIVAHRVTTLEMCDRIYELDRGNIKGVYNYNEVFNKLLNN